MANNHEEHSNNLENLKCSVKVYWGCMYLYRKSRYNKQMV